MVNAGSDVRLRVWLTLLPVETGFLTADRQGNRITELIDYFGRRDAEIGRHVPELVFILRSSPHRSIESLVIIVQRGSHGSRPPIETALGSGVSAHNFANVSNGDLK